MSTEDPRALLADGVLEKKEGKDVLRFERRLAHPIERVWAALTEDVEAWWGSPYLQGEATSLVLEPWPGGMFREDWGDGQGAVWGVVGLVERGRRLELHGAMGMTGAVAGVTRFGLDPIGDGSTRLRLSHEAFGHLDPDTQRNYGLGWQDLLGVRLKAYLDEGIRYGLGHPPPSSAPSFLREEREDPA